MSIARYSFIFYLGEEYSLIYLHLSVARYSFIQLGELLECEVKKVSKMQQKDSNPGSHD